MNKSELNKLIKEEVSKTLNEKFIPDSFILFMNSAESTLKALVRDGTPLERGKELLIKAIKSL